MLLIDHAKAIDLPGDSRCVLAKLCELFQNLMISVASLGRLVSRSIHHNVVWGGAEFWVVVCKWVFELHNARVLNGSCHVATKPLCVRALYDWSPAVFLLSCSIWRKGTTVITEPNMSMNIVRCSVFMQQH